jgi:uncharacterized protein YkwD
MQVARTRIVRWTAAMTTSVVLFSVATSPAQARPRRSSRNCTAKVTTKCRRVTPAPVTPTAVPPTAVTLQIQAPAAVSQEANALLSLVNNARSVARNCGSTAAPAVAPVQWDSRLEVAASAHSSYLASIGTLTHQGSGGTSPTDRVAAVGGPRVPVGETIAWNYPTPEATIDGWMRSPGHCSIIMMERFTRVAWVRVGSYDTLNIAAS